MRDLTKREVELVLMGIDAAIDKEKEGASRNDLEKLMELFEMELVLKEQQRKPSISRKEKKDG